MNHTINDFAIWTNPQQELFSCLKAWQRKKVAAVLRPLKPWAQGKLCDALLDYMQTAELEVLDDMVLNTLALYLTGMADGNARAIIRPLTGPIDEECEKGIGANTSFETNKK